MLGCLPSRRYCREICSRAFSNALRVRSWVPAVNICEYILEENCEYILEENQLDKRRTNA